MRERWCARCTACAWSTAWSRLRFMHLWQCRSRSSPSLVAKSVVSAVTDHSQTNSRGLCGVWQGRSVCVCRVGATTYGVRYQTWTKKMIRYFSRVDFCTVSSQQADVTRFTRPPLLNSWSAGTHDSRDSPCFSHLCAIFGLSPSRPKSALAVMGVRVCVAAGAAVRSPCATPANASPEVYVTASRILRRVHERIQRLKTRETARSRCCAKTSLNPHP